MVNGGETKARLESGLIDGTPERYVSITDINS